MADVAVPLVPGVRSVLLSSPAADTINIDVADAHDHDLEKAIVVYGDHHNGDDGGDHMVIMMIVMLMMMKALSDKSSDLFWRIF